MTIQEREEIDRVAETTVIEERQNPRPGIHAERWNRIKELDRLLKEIVASNTQNKKASKHLPPYNETDEWKALVYESEVLTSIETAHALDRDWPIWQEGQHFLYLDSHNELREGEVDSFNVDEKTIECTTWPRFDFHGYVNAPGARESAIIKIQQLHDAEKRLEELNEEQRRVAAAADLERQRNCLPLLADLLT